MGFAHEKHQPKGRLKPKIPFQTTIKAKARTPKNQGPDYKEEKTTPSVRTPFRRPSRIQAYSDPPSPEQVRYAEIHHPPHTFRHPHHAGPDYRLILHDAARTRQPLHRRQKRTARRTGQHRSQIPPERPDVPAILQLSQTTRPRRPRPLVQIQRLQRQRAARPSSARFRRTGRVRLHRLHRLGRTHGHHRRTQAQHMGGLHHHDRRHDRHRRPQLRQSPHHDFHLRHHPQMAARRRLE